MLDVSSRTALSVLFSTLRYAMSDKDATTHRKALNDAARRPAVTRARTIDADTAPHLTYYAQGIVKTQASLAANYKYEMVQAANPAIYNVVDRRPAGDERVRIVTIEEASMHCSCGFPLTYLLPCRHVLVVNNHMYNAEFRVAQVGKRWLRAHMPAIREQSVSTSSLPPLDVSVPSFVSSVAVPSKNLPSRGAQYATIMGWCNTMASVAVDTTGLYSYFAGKVRALCQEAEALASQPSAIRSERLTTSVASTSSSSSAQPELHPLVEIDQMQIPPHRAPKRGRTSNKRQKSAVELASRGMRTPAPMTASQTM